MMNRLLAGPLKHAMGRLSHGCRCPVTAPIRSWVRGCAQDADDCASLPAGRHPGRCRLGIRIRHPIRVRRGLRSTRSTARRASHTRGHASPVHGISRTGRDRRCPARPRPVVWHSQFSASRRIVFQVPADEQGGWRAADDPEPRPPRRASGPSQPKRPAKRCSHRSALRRTPCGPNRRAGRAANVLRRSKHCSRQGIRSTTNSRKSSKRKSMQGGRRCSVLPKSMSSAPMSHGPWPTSERRLARSAPALWTLWVMPSTPLLRRCRHGLGPARPRRFMPFKWREPACPWRRPGSNMRKPPGIRTGVSSSCTSSETVRATTG